MGEDKSFLTYHDKSQCYHVYELIGQFCERTFISCNAEQSGRIDKNYKAIEDKKSFAGKGPATGVLTAFSIYPQKNLLVVACDYPLLTAKEIAHFLNSIPERSITASFYDEREQAYQPVIAFYSSEAGSMLMRSPQTSLMQLLRHTDAYRHIPLDESSIKSIDTREASEKIMQVTKNNS